MLQHLKGYQRSTTLIKTGRLNKINNTIAPSRHHITRDQRSFEIRFHFE